MYTSYLILFLHFFFNTYLKPKAVAIDTHKSYHMASNGVDKVHNGTDQVPIYNGVDKVPDCVSKVSDGVHKVGNGVVKIDANEMNGQHV